MIKAFYGPQQAVVVEPLPIAPGFDVSSVKYGSHLVALVKPFVKRNHKHAVVRFCPLCVPSEISQKPRVSRFDAAAVHVVVHVGNDKRYRR